LNATTAIRGAALNNPTVCAEAEYGRGGQLSREAEYQSSVITTDRPAPPLAVFAEH
jgi:hypothetical protein